MIIFFLALLISANMFKYWFQWLLKTKRCRGETLPWFKSNKSAALFKKLFHNIRLDWAWPLLPNGLVLPLFCLLDGEKRGSSRCPYGSFFPLLFWGSWSGPVISGQVLFRVEPVDLSQSANSYWSVMAIKSMRLETLIAILWNYFQFVEWN